MANSYSDTTGVLKLAKVTPVIEALFGGFNLDANYPGDGLVYIAKLSEETYVTWEDIAMKLGVVACNLKLIELPDPDMIDADSFARVITALVKHYGHSNRIDIEGPYEMDEEADFEALFEIACAFDDGHGLASLQVEGSWHCSKPRLGEFGGVGLFMGRRFMVRAHTGIAESLGPAVEAALLSGDVAGCTQLFVSHVWALMQGIESSEVRKEVTRSLGQVLPTFYLAR